MDDVPPEVWAAAHMLVARAHSNSTSSSTLNADDATRPPVYKAIGLTLAVASGLFIGTSFVLKKIGLLKANAKYNEEAGEGYGYLKNAYWWTGMTLMIMGEICNFVAYAFVDAILVTPLGALSVVVTTILSAIFLKERLSFVGKVGCFNCIIGSVVIVMNAPEQSAVADIQEMKHFVLAPGFLSYAGVIVVGCAIIALWVAPKYGKKSMLVYLSICSLIGGLSVVATQGLGSAVVAQAGGKPQFNQWFLYLLLVFVVTTLVTEIIYLNKALNLFNAALVTPTYYVFFTSATIVTSAILFQGFKGTPISIATVIMGFLVICSGVVLLQMSKSAKDVPDAAVFKGDLDQVREIGQVEQPESEPKADAIRGTAALIRRISVSRQKMEQQEAQRLREEKRKDLLEPVRENEIVEWDGLRRRKTIIGPPGSAPVRRKTVHPPLGMSHFPEPDEDQDRQQHSNGLAFFGNASSSPVHPITLTDIRLHPSKADSPIVPFGPGSLEEAQEHIYGLPAGLRNEQDRGPAEGTPHQSPRSKPLPAKPPPSPLSVGKPAQEARRQFSFTNFLHRQPRTPVDGDDRPTSKPAIASSSSAQHRAMKKTATEEERLGLVKGDSHSHLLSSSILHLDRDHACAHGQTSGLDDYDEKLHDYEYLARPASLSDPDDDDDRQTPCPPLGRPTGYNRLAMRAVTPAATRSARRRPSPPRLYYPAMPPAYTQNPSLQTTSTAAPLAEAMVTTNTAPSYEVLPAAVFDPSQTLTTIQGQEVATRGATDKAAAQSEVEEMAKKRFEEESRREREMRRKRLSSGKAQLPPGFKNRRQSFAAASDDGTDGIHPRELAGDGTGRRPTQADRLAFYRMRSNLSDASMDSEALLDHRDHRPMRARANSRHLPNILNQIQQHSPVHTSSFLASSIQRREGAWKRVKGRQNHGVTGADDDNAIDDYDIDEFNDRTPLLSGASLHRSPAPEGYNLRHYDINNPPSVPGSPSLEPHHEIDDVMVAHGDFLTRSANSRRNLAASSRDALIDCTRSIHLAPEGDVCFPTDDISEIIDQHLGRSTSAVSRAWRRPRRGEWPQLHILDEWSQQEKEIRAGERRAKKVSEPVLVEGRLRPRQYYWHRTEEDAPYRFTYFCEEFESTIHAQTISELVQPGASFRELFIPDPPELADSNESDTSDDDHDGGLEMGGGRSDSEGHVLSPKVMLSPHPPTATVRRFNSTMLGDPAAPPPASADGSGKTSGRATPRRGIKAAKAKKFGERPTFWLDVLCPTDQEMRVLCKTFGIHALTAEDIMMQEAREKVELFHNYYFINYRTFEQDTNSEDYLEPVNMYVCVFRYGIITFHFSQVPHPANVRRRIRQLSDYLILSADWISYAIIDDITDAYHPLVASIEQEVDDIDDLILNALQSTNVMSLYRLLGQKADVIKGFAKRCNEQWEVAPKSEIGLYLGDIQDHIITMSSNLSHYEALLSRAHSNYLAQVNIRMGERQESTADILGKLTVIGTIVLPMNIICGMWGMNVKVPGQEIDNLNWFWAIAAGLVLFAIACYTWCKRVYKIV
ncbi:hypothetical protein DV736_g178, partial [Chaetothyriales sp. CBS 134916]